MSTLATKADAPSDLTAGGEGISNRWETWGGWAALALVLLSFITIGRSPFNDPDEFYYITAAQNMVRHGDWITPHFNDQPRIRKPILFYWIVGSAYEIFGIHITVARLCSALAAAAGIAGVWRIGRHLLGSRAGLLAALMAAGHLSVAQMVRFATTDTTLWAFCTWAQYGFIRIAFPIPANDATAKDDAEPKARHAWLFFAGTALALLTKGPVALVWCLVPMLWLFIRRDWRALRQMRWGSGLLIMALLVAPWASLFVARIYQNLRATLWDPNSDQSFNHFAGPFQSLTDLARIVPQLMPSILPWLALIVCVFGEWRERRFVARTRCVHFLVFWLAALLILLTVARGKSFRYMLPPVAPTSLLLAGWFAGAIGNRAMRWPLTKAAAVYGVAMFLLSTPILLILFKTRGMDTRWLWLHVGIQFAAGSALLIWRRRPLLHRLIPAMMVAVIYVQGGLVNLTVPPLAGATMAALAPAIEHSLPPDQPLVLYSGLTPKYLIFYTSRPQLETDSLEEFCASLKTARACLVKESDWRTVPVNLRSLFTVADSVRVERDREGFNFDLDKNLETVLLVVRGPEAPPVHEQTEEPSPQPLP